MKRFHRSLKEIQKQSKLSKVFFSLSIAGILLTLTIAITLPNYLLKNYQQASASAKSKQPHGRDTTPPTVSLTMPASGSSVSGTAVTISATAADNVGVSGVTFFVDNGQIGSEDTGAPYNVSWNTTGIANGTHTLTAKARDAAGNIAISAPRNVIVTNTTAAAVYLSNYSSLAAAVQQIGSTTTTLVIDKPAPVTANLTVPANITMQFNTGNMMTISNRVTVDIKGPVIASATQQIFQPGQTSKIAAINAPQLYPQWFGAKGDGATNDTTAFQQVSAVVNSMGRGTITIPQGTYIVGRQIFAGATGKGYAYRGEEIMAIKNTTGKVIIQGAPGASPLPKLRAADGMKFGSFDPVTGAVVNMPAPFTNYDYRAGLYNGMVFINKNTDVEVKDLEMDGNIFNVVLGGSWGDTGYQVEGSGVWAYENEKVLLSNIYVHHQPLDGVIIGHTGLTETDAPKPYTMTKVVSEYNARQGLSWVGGNSLTVTDSKFNHTGKARFASAPGAGVDLESESSIIRNGYFENSEFINNSGAGIVTESGDVDYATFKNIVAWGTTFWSVWLRNPHIVVQDSYIYGPVPQGYGSADPSAALQFIRTTFEDKPYPGVGVYNGGYLVAMGHANELFDGCTFIANSMRLAWMDGTEIVRNSTFIHKYASLPDRDFVAVLRGTTLENVHFKTDVTTPPAHNWYIEAGNNIDRGIYVDGPYLKWGAP